MLKQCEFFKTEICKTNCSELAGLMSADAPQLFCGLLLIETSKLQRQSGTTKGSLTCWSGCGRDGAIKSFV